MIHYLAAAVAGLLRSKKEIIPPELRNGTATSFLSMDDYGEYHVAAVFPYDPLARLSALSVSRNEQSK